jgi:uncharacterized membrane protein
MEPSPEDEPEWFRPPAATESPPPDAIPPASTIPAAPTPSARPAPLAARLLRGRFTIPGWVPRPSPTVVAIILAALIESVILTWVQTQNYLGFHTRQGDLGNYNQAFWTTIHGEGFFAYTTNIPGGSDGTLWSVHFSPTFILVVPFYAIAASPVTLIFLKQIALALGAVPVYGIAKVYFPRNFVPVLFAALYLLSPFTLAGDWNNFDPESFIPLTVLVALYFFTVGRFWPFIFSLLLALGTIESVPPLLILFAFGGLIGSFLAQSRSPYWTSRQQRRPLLIALLVSAAWFGIAYEVLQKLGHGGGFSTSYGSRFKTLGATSLEDVPFRAITHPGVAGAALHFDGSMKLVFVGVILLATGGLCILGGIRYGLPVVGFLSLALLSSSPPFYVFGSQYTSMILPFLFVGTIEGTVWVTDWLDGRDPGDRHRQLALRLSTEARTMLAGLILLPSTDPSRDRAVARLQRVVKLLGADELGLAEVQMRRVRRELGISPPLPTLSIPAPVVPTDGATPTDSTSSGAVQRRSRFRPDTVQSLNAAPFVILVITILVAAAYANPLLPNPVAGGPQTQYGIAGPTPQDSQLQTVLDLIPPQASVLTTSHLFPQVSSRPNAYVVNNATWLPAAPINETIASDINSWLNLSEYMVVDYWADSSNAFLYYNDANLSGFGLYAAEDGANLYARGWTGTPAWLPWSEPPMAGGSLTLHNGAASDTYASSAGPSYYHPAGNLSGASLWSGPRDLYIPPGNYSVTFDLELLAPSPGAQLRLEVTDSPALINEDIIFHRGGYNFRQIGINASAIGPLVLTSKVVSQPPTDQPTSLFETLDFSWNGTGYLSFPGIEMSTTMSVYLVSVAVSQTSPLF